MANTGGRVYTLEIVQQLLHFREKYRPPVYKIQWDCHPNTTTLPVQKGFGPGMIHKKK